MAGQFSGQRCLQHLTRLVVALLALHRQAKADRGKRLHIAEMPDFRRDLAETHGGFERPDGQVESPGKVASQIDQPLLVALTRAFYWQQLLDDGVVGSGSDIARREGLHYSTVNELLRLTLLEPAIIQSILAGQQPRCMSLLWFQRNPLPTDWMAQREVVTAFDA